MPKHKSNPKAEKEAEHHHHHRSESKPDKNRFFQDSQKGNQTVSVTVNVEQPKEDCLSGCFAALTQCFKKGG